MPVVEFALDPAAQYRVQVHVPIEQNMYTVMLNRSVLGFLASPDEQRAGKYFVLPDRSTLYVRIEGRHPHVFRNNYLLAPLDAKEVAALDAAPLVQSRKSSEGLLARIKKVTGMV